MCNGKPLAFIKFVMRFLCSVLYTFISYMWWNLGKYSFWAISFGFCFVLEMNQRPQGCDTRSDLSILFLISFTQFLKQTNTCHVYYILSTVILHTIHSCGI